MGVDGLELGERLPTCEARDARSVEKQGHFRAERDHAEASVDVAGIFEKGVEDRFFGRRCLYEDSLGSHRENYWATAARADICVVLS